MFEDLSLDIIIPVIITLIGFISYFFGKIISETYPGVEERSQHYIYGFMFVLIYLILPLTIIYYFRESILFNLNLFTGIIFFILLSLITQFFHTKQKVYVVRKGQAYHEFEKEALRRTNQILEKLRIPSDSDYIKRIFRFAFVDVPRQQTVLILTFIEIFLLVNLIYSSNVIFGVIFLILFISSMSNIAQLSVARGINYPLVVVEDCNGKKYEGRIIKYGKEFISIRDKRDVYNFVRENVKFSIAKEVLPTGDTISKNLKSQQKMEKKND